VTPPGPLFPGPRGAPLTRDAISRIVTRHVATAIAACPSLATKRVTPHVLRHSCAMQFRRWRRRAVIALWLGHESIRTDRHLPARRPRLKERALAKAASPSTAWRRYRPADTLLAFLEGL